MQDLSDKVLMTINQKSIKPRPKWYFLMRGCVLWGLAGLTTLLGGLAFSLIIFFTYFQGFGLSHPHDTGKIRWLLVSVPYAWFLVFLLLIGVIYYNLKHLKKSYKYPAYLLVVASLCGSIILGALISGMGIHRRMNIELSRRLPFYGQIFDARIPAWGRPGEGALAGKIGSTTDEAFILQDFNGQEWRIIFRDDTVEEAAVLIVPEQMVLINGHPGSPGVFIASEIFPWEGCHKKCNLIKPLLPRRSPGIPVMPRK
ncbi:MAG: hypothetical protein NT165_03500 [Candidatus Falkowbacteria bacterium]|nr:hypothetical protein [Candidatus Falkowbacteria bacterium]